MATITLVAANTGAKSEFDAIKADYWEVRTAAALLLGGKPIVEGWEDGPAIVSAELRPSDQDRFKFVCELTYRAIDAGVLPHVGKRKERLVKPADFYSWAVSKGYVVPDEWVSAFSITQTAAPAAPAIDPRSVMVDLTGGPSGKGNATPHQSASRLAKESPPLHRSKKRILCARGSKPMILRGGLNHAQIANQIYQSRGWAVAESDQ